MDKLISVSYSIDSHKLVLVITTDKTRAYSWPPNYREYHDMVSAIETQTANVKLGFNPFNSVLSFEAVL